MRDEDYERHERLWHSGHASSELEIVTNPSKLRARAAVRHVEQTLEDAREQAEADRYAQYIATVGRSFDRHRGLKIAAIQRVVCSYYWLTRTELLSQRRTAKVVLPRQVAMYLVRIITDKSYPEIGRAFADRDHTTILHACNRIAAQMATDAVLAADVAELRRRLEGGL
jgi:chromosomal replication initiation ATPase DnaA